MVIGIVHMFDIEVRMLIDSRVMHSFISCEFDACMCMTLILLDYHIKVCTLMREFLWPIQVLKRGLFCIDGQVMKVDLILLDL